jgi:hypothetical protein
MTLTERWSDGAGSWFGFSAEAETVVEPEQVPTADCHSICDRGDELNYVETVVMAMLHRSGYRETTLPKNVKEAQRSEN